MMIVRGEVINKIQSLRETRLNEVFDLVEEIETRDPGSEPRTLLQHLRRIKINGPADFSRSIDLYLSGEKKIEENVDRYLVYRFANQCEG